MKIDHIAIWTTHLEELRDFYTEYFNGTSNEKYTNPMKGFESYFIKFNDNSASLELMRRKDITTATEEGRTGITHISFATGSKKAVLSMTEQFRQDGFTIASEPRTTGDGFFESAILDPDGNLIELTI